MKGSALSIPFSSRSFSDIQKRKLEKNNLNKGVKDRDFILVSIDTAYLWYFYSYKNCVLAFGFMCISSASDASCPICIE